MIRPMDATNEKYINLDKYTYDISDILLTYDTSKEPITIDSKYLKTLSINNSFETTVTPSYMMDLTVEKKYYREIITHMNTLIVSFSIYKINIGNPTNAIESTSVNNSFNHKELYAEINLKAINNENISTNTENKLPTDITANDEDSNTTDYTQDILPLTLYLYDYEKLTKYKKCGSYIIDGGLNDCLFQLFASRGFNNVMADAVTDNAPDKKVKGTYSISYGNLGDNLKNLNNCYGIYDYPYLFYMGIKRTYMLNKGNLGKCLQLGEIGTVNIYLEKIDEPGSLNGVGSYCDDINKLYILNAISFEINDSDSAIDYVAGGNIRTIIRGTGEVKQTKIGEYNIEKTYVVENEKQHNQLLYSINESKRTVSIVFESVDFDIFTPNKLFAIIADDTYYSKDYNISGKYRLVGSSMIIAKNGENEFKGNIMVNLAKIS